MRVAVVSDIHANLPALEAVADDIARAGVQETWCLGDVVGYGASPRETLAWVGKAATVCVKGNHDQAVATGNVDGFNPVAAHAARYHAQLLAPPERTRLHDLPHQATRRLSSGQPRLDGSKPVTDAHFPFPAVADDGQGIQALLVHASPDDPLREYVFVSSAGRDLQRWQGLADIILMGHTHVPFVAEAGPSSEPSWRADGFAQRLMYPRSPGRALTLVNPGSVGQPRDGDPRASYAILDGDARTIELRRVEYDIDAAALAIRQARMDAYLAQRLYRGV